MDVSKYAALFLAESREHLSACNQLLLEWEREPSATRQVGGLFRAIHTIKGMGATMGYAGVADLAHRLENLLDALRQRTVPPAPAVFQLLFRSVDALTTSVEGAVVGLFGLVLSPVRSVWQAVVVSETIVTSAAESRVSFMSAFSRLTVTE